MTDHNETRQKPQLQKETHLVISDTVAGRVFGLTGCVRREHALLSHSEHVSLLFDWESISTYSFQVKMTYDYFACKDDTQLGADTSYFLPLHHCAATAIVSLLCFASRNVSLLALIFLTLLF